MFDATPAGGVVFHAAAGLDAPAVAAVQAGVRRRLLRVFVRRGLLPSDEAQAMARWAQGSCVPVWQLQSISMTASEHSGGLLRVDCRR